MSKIKADELSLDISVKDNGSAEKLDKLADAIARLKKESEGLQSKVPSTSAQDKPKEERTKRFIRLQERLKKIYEDIANREKKSGENNLLSSIKRVATYRAIRTGLKLISQSVKDTAQTLAQVNPQVNQTMSQLTSSLTILKGSLGVIVLSLLPLVSKFLTGLATDVATLANAISLASAQIQGQSTYIRVNTEYWKDYNSAIQGTLLSFDTFTTLNNKNAFDGLFDAETPIAKATQKELDLAEKLKPTLDALTNISDFIKDIVDEIGTLKTIIGVIIALNFVNILSNVISIGSKLIGTIGGISNAIYLVSRAIAFIGIKTYIDGLGKINTAAKILIPTLATLAAAAAAFYTPGEAFVKTAAALTTFGAIMGLGTKAYTGFADGGMMNGVGTMYAVAGEAGAEIVAQGSRGTGVVNVEQFKTAMVQALYEYGASRGNLNNISVQMDSTKVGKAVAKSSYGEMVRSGLL